MLHSREHAFLLCELAGAKGISGYLCRPSVDNQARRRIRIPEVNKGPPRIYKRPKVQGAQRPKVTNPEGHARDHVGNVIL